MTLPNFLIIGAQKSGTSYLGRQLHKHPQIYCHPREIHFFDKSHNFFRGLAWYEQIFSEAGNSIAVGEKTPDYMWANGVGAEGHMADVHRNLHETLPDAKLIAVLRNPVNRAVSAAWHIVRSGRVSPFRSLDELLIGDKQDHISEHGVIEYGHYAELLEAYFELFDPKRFLILIFEDDIVHNPAQALKKVCEFLQVDADYSFSGLSEKINEGKISLPVLVANYYLPSLKKFHNRLNRLLPAYLPRPSNETVDALYRHYAPHNEALFALLGRKIASWQR